MSQTKCPICNKPTDAQFKPFCSSRCATIDLGRWIGGDYAVRTNESPDAPTNGQDDDF